jgi:hypothetical protein
MDWWPQETIQTPWPALTHVAYKRSEAQIKILSKFTIGLHKALLYVDLL